MLMKYEMGGKTHTSVEDGKIRHLPLQSTTQSIYPSNQLGKNQIHKINDPPCSDCIKEGASKIIVNSSDDDTVFVN